MTIDQLRNALRATPFRPFTMRMADGRVFPVAHPDFVAVSPAGRTAVVYDSHDSVSILDFLLMTELDWTAPSTGRPPENGAG